MDTGLIDRGEAATLPPESEGREAMVAFAASQGAELRSATDDDPWHTLVGFRLNGPAPLKLEVAPRGGDPVSLSVEGETVTIADGETYTAGPDWAWEIADSGGETWVAAGPEAFAFRLVEPVVEGAAAGAQGSLEAPMPGTVLELRVSPGESVAEGQVLVVIESMKMEMSLTAPTEATIAEVLVVAGEGVKQGQSLVELEPLA
jgi:acetyl/propionyl-CoA carboxylase alpha subunit